MAFAKLGRKILRNKKTAYKFKLTTFYERIDCELQRGYEPNTLRIKWVRGHREVESATPLWAAETEDDTAVQGKARFEPVLPVELLVTLYKGAKSVEYEDKLYKYSIEDTSLNGKKRLLGVFELNVAEYANVAQNRYELALICKPMHKLVFNIKIVMTLEVEFLKSGSAQDDDMISTWSALPGNDNYASDDEGSTDDGGFRSRGMSTDLSAVMGENLLSLIDRNRQELLLPDGFHLDFGGLSEYRAVALLFSANWSDTCTKFLQIVDRFYNHPNIKENRAFEIIYVSCDFDDESLLQAIKKHSIGYPSIKPKSILAESLKEHYEITSIPQLLLVHPETGRIIEKDCKKELERCQTSQVEQKLLSSLWSKGKNSAAIQKSLLTPDLTTFGSSASISSSALDSISEGGISSTSSTRRKGSMKQGNTDQNIMNLESRLRQKENELREANERLQEAYEEVSSLTSDNETLRTQNFEMSDQVRQLKIIVKEFGDQNRAMADEKQQLVAAMEVKGWLFKRGVSGPTGRMWRRRYFQTNGFSLAYYKSINSQVEQGSIDLRKVNEISVLPPEKQDKNLASFNIVTDSRVYELEAMNPSEMNRWIRAVNYLSKYHYENKLMSLRVMPRDTDEVQDPVENGSTA